MTKIQIIIIGLLVAFMAAAAFLLGQWSETLNPDGIMPHPGVDGDTSETAPAVPRNAFTFGVSIGLLGMSMLYCVIAAGLLIRSKIQRKLAGGFTYSVAGLAAVGFVLSYVVDDYFY